jgi:hypothetical protein
MSNLSAEINGKANARSSLIASEVAMFAPDMSDRGCCLNTRREEGEFLVNASPEGHAGR